MRHVSAQSVINRWRLLYEKHARDTLNVGVSAKCNCTARDKQLLNGQMGRSVAVEEEKKERTKQ